MPGVQLCPRKRSTSGESSAALPAKLAWHTPLSIKRGADLRVPTSHRNYRDY